MTFETRCEVKGDEWLIMNKKIYFCFIWFIKGEEEEEGGLL